MRSLTERIELRKNNNYPTSTEWVRYLKDRRTHLLKTSSVVGIDSEGVYRYRYNLYRLLLDNKYPPELMWVVLWINGLKSEEDFNNVDALTIPSQAEINKLLTTYKSYNAQYKKVQDLR